jgi:hypothetical protein
VLRSGLANGFIQIGGGLRLISAVLQRYLNQVTGILRDINAENAVLHQDHNLLLPSTGVNVSDCWYCVGARSSALLPIGVASRLESPFE